MSFRVTLAALTAAAAVAFGAAAFAQQSSAPAAAGAPHAHRANRYMAALRSVGLSADQESRIKSIVQGYRAKDKDADQATRRSDRAAMRSQIEAVLTPDQRTRLSSAMAQERAEQPGRTQ